MKAQEAKRAEEAEMQDAPAEPAPQPRMPFAPPGMRPPVAVPYGVRVVYPAPVFPSAPAAVVATVPPVAGPPPVAVVPTAPPGNGANRR